MKQSSKHAILLILIAIGMGCATYDFPYAHLLPERAAKNLAMQTAASPSPAVRPSAPRAMAKRPQRDTGNYVSRGTAIPPNPVVKVEQLPSPPVKRSFERDPADLDREWPKTPEEHVADARRVFESGNLGDPLAQSVVAIPIRPPIQPPAKDIPYWDVHKKKPDDNSASPGSGVAPHDPRLSGGPALVTWPSPIPLPPAVNEMWRLYRTFAFQSAIELAMELAARETVHGYSLATAYMLAAASAHLIGGSELAQRFIVLSTAVEPGVCPDPKAFPSAFCQLFARVNRQQSAEVPTS
jgi:hypothetical protein